jgi:hypothetical protein
MVFVVISPFAFLILLIWVFSSPYFSQGCQGSVDLAYFLLEPTFCFINCVVFLVSISLI